MAHVLTGDIETGRQFVGMFRKLRPTATISLGAGLLLMSRGGEKCLRKAFERRAFPSDKCHPPPRGHIAADVAAYSRLMGADEIGALEVLKTVWREIGDPTISAHNGRIVKTTGDGILVEFASAVDAMTCAVAFQEKMAERCKAGEGLKLAFRID